MNKFKKSFWIFAFSILSITFFHAQVHAQDKEDVIYLKDGSTIRGELIESNATEVKIQILGGSIFVYKATLVDKIVKEPALNPKAVTQSQSPSRQYDKGKGYLLELHSGLLIGQPGNESTGAAFGIVNGYQFGKKFGAGVGVQWNGLQNESFLPVYAALRYRPSSRLPFVLGLNSGYGFPIGELAEDTERDGGWFFNPEIAFHMATAYSFNWFASVGYQQNPVSYAYTRPWDNAKIQNEEIYRRFALKLGISF